MINIDNVSMIGEYVLVKPIQTENTSIILRSHEDDKVLMGTVLSVDVEYEEEVFEDDDDSYTVTFNGDYYNGDKILFNRAKSLPIPRDIQEDEVFIVRKEDVFGVFNNEETTGEQYGLYNYQA